MDRRRFLPSYHYEDNTDGVLINSVGKPLRDYKIYGAEGGVGNSGINLFDESVIESRATDGTNDDEWAINNYSGVFYNKLSFKENTRYTLAFTAKQTSGDTRLQFVYTDGTVGNIGTWRFATEYTAYVGSSLANKTVSHIKMEYGNSGLAFIKKGSVMLVEGVYTASTMPEYEPYRESAVIHLDVSGDVYEISVPKPLGEGDYIDYMSQTVVIDGESTAAELPEIILPKGDVSITVETDTAPGGVLWQYYRR